MIEKELTPQQRANRRQNEQRRNLPKIPTLIISEDEAALLSELAAIHGSKKAAILAGLRLLKEKEKSTDLHCEL
jgi:hypothetical protein